MEPVNRAVLPPDGPSAEIMDDPAQEIVIEHPPIDQEPPRSPLVLPIPYYLREDDSPEPGPSRRNAHGQHSLSGPTVPIDRRERDREEHSRIRRRRQIDRELERMRQELSRPHPSLRNDFFGDGQPVDMNSLQSFNSCGEKQLDMLSLLPPAVIKRIVKKLEPNEFIRMEATCKGMKVYCEEDDNWRPNVARGMFYKRDKCFVMRSPYEEELQTLQKINSFRYRLTVPYMCIWGNITEAKLSEIMALLLTNGCKIRKITFGAAGFAEREDELHEDTSVEATPEKLNDFAETFGIEEIQFVQNTAFNVEAYTTARMGRVIRKMHFPSAKHMDYRQLHRMKFETLTCAIPIQPFDAGCVLPLIREWHKDQREIKFISITTAPDTPIETEQTLTAMSEDINIRGGPLWQTFYENAETGEFFPLKWADPATKDSAWIFVHDRKKPILYLFFLESRVLLGTIEGFRENASVLPATILLRSLDNGSDYRSDINDRSQFHSRTRQIVRLIDHAALMQREDRVSGARRRRRVLPRNDERRAVNPLVDGVRFQPRTPTFGEPLHGAPLLRFPPMFAGPLPHPAAAPEGEPAINEPEPEDDTEPEAGEAIEQAHARARAFGVAFMENNLVDDPEDRIRAIWDRIYERHDDYFMEMDDDDVLVNQHDFGEVFIPRSPLVEGLEVDEDIDIDIDERRVQL